jgi:hypothetical protein
LLRSRLAPERRMLLAGLKLNYACEAPMLSQKGLELRRAQGADGQGREGQEEKQRKTRMISDFLVEQVIRGDYSDHFALGQHDYRQPSSAQKAYYRVQWRFLAYGWELVNVRRDFLVFLCI